MRSINQIEQDNCTDVWITAILCAFIAFVFSCFVGCCPIVVNPLHDRDGDRHDRRDENRDHKDHWKKQ